MASVLLEVRGLKRYYGTGAVLAGASLILHAGTVNLLTGRNGTGKTTLLNCLSGFDRQYRGTILLRGSRIDGESADSRARMGLVRTFQEPQLFGNVCVKEQVALGALASWHPLRSYLRWSWRSEFHLGSELKALADRPAAKLSFGEMKLVNLERALATRADVLLLDEPLASIHAERREEVIAKISEARLRGAGILIVEHDVDGVLHLVDHRYELREGALREIS